jgi:protein involved in polysaccharide export with SLBB domain
VVAIFFDVKQGGNFSNPFLDALQAAKVHKKNKTYSDELSTRLSRL